MGKKCIFDIYVFHYQHICTYMLIYLIYRDTHMYVYIYQYMISIYAYSGSHVQNIPIFIYIIQLYKQGWLYQNQRK